MARRNHEACSGKVRGSGPAWLQVGVLAALDPEMSKLREKRRSPAGQRRECTATEVRWCSLALQTLRPPLAPFDWSRRMLHASETVELER